MPLLARRAACVTTIALLAAFAGLAIAPSATFAQPTARGAAAARDAEKGDNLPIKRITLYRSGVGSFERRGLVEGNAAVQLRFKTEQVNDILKSMVALDLSKNGTVDNISYGSKEPLNRRLASFGVDISGNPTLGKLLAALRGTEVVVTFPDSKVEGVILGVETKMESVTKDAPLMAVEYLNLVTASGIRSIKISLANAIELKDKELNAELSKALAAVAEYREDRTKTVEVNFTGEGQRDCVIAYVQEAPVWKTSYRLVLPDAAKRPDGKAEAAKADDRFTMQAWAIVENTTDEDWKEVALSLVAGRPVSFRMDLYEPLFVFRPEIPVPTVPGVMPRSYAAGVDLPPQEAEKNRMEASETRAFRSAGRGGAPGSPAAAPAPAMKADADRSYSYAAVSAEDMSGYAARAQGTATEAGEVFMYQVDHPVTVERQRSAMIPIINAGIDGRRVSIFNPSDGGEHPMRGLEIKNSTNLQFMPGPISVFDGGAYAGDAQIGHVPAGDKRLLAYAVDLDINAARKDNSLERIRKVKLVRGVFELTSLYEQGVTYSFTNKDKARDRMVIVEQPRLEGWNLAKPDKPYETTATLYRFEVPVDAGKSNSVEIKQEMVSSRTIGVTSMDLQTLLAYSRQGGVVSDQVIQAFKEAQRLQSLVSEAQRRIQDLETRRAAIDTDQNRLRQNMQSIDRTSELYTRYLKKLTDQETQVEQIAGDLDKAREALRKAESDFNNYVANLNVE